MNEEEGSAPVVVTEIATFRWKAKDRVVKAIVVACRDLVERKLCD